MTYGRPSKSTEIIGLFSAIHFQKCDGNCERASERAGGRGRGRGAAGVMLFHARNLDQIPASLSLAPLGLGALFDFYRLGRARERESGRVLNCFLREKRPYTCESGCANTQ